MEDIDSIWLLGSCSQVTVPWVYSINKHHAPASHKRSHCLLTLFWHRPAPILPAACTTSVGSPTFIGCDLGQSVTWAAGDTVEVTVPVTAGLNGAVNAINTAIVSDNQGRQSNATFPITINVDSAVRQRVLKYNSQTHRSCSQGIVSRSIAGFRRVYSKATGSHMSDGAVCACCVML